MRFTNTFSRIQAGMVFVSMSADEPLARTAQHQIQYAGTGPRASHRRRRLGQPSEEYLNSYRTPLQTLERASLAGFGSPDSDTDARASPGASTGENADHPPEFRVTTDYDEHPDGNEFGTLGDNLPMPQGLDSGRSEAVGAVFPPLEDDFMCSDSEYSSPSDEDDDPEAHAYNLRRRELQRQVRAMRRQYAMEQDETPRRRHVPNTIQPILPSASSEPRSGSNTHASDTGLMKPLAQFFIRRPKSSVSLQFDPPP